MARESAVRIGLVYPELLGTYGDRGNALVLVQRCHWRGIAAELVEVAAGEPIPDSLDVYLFGGGEDDAAGDGRGRDARVACRTSSARSRTAARWCSRCAPASRTSARATRSPTATVIEGMGLVDAVTVAGSPRLIGEVVVRARRARSPASPGSRTTAAAPTLGPGVRPLGRVARRRRQRRRRGRRRRARASDSSRTYLHGPVLPRNPALADLVLALDPRRPRPARQRVGGAAARRAPRGREQDRDRQVGPGPPARPRLTRIPHASGARLHYRGTAERRPGRGNPRDRPRAGDWFSPRHSRQRSRSA